VEDLENTYSARPEETKFRNVGVCQQATSQPRKKSPWATKPCQNQLTPITVEPCSLLQAKQKPLFVFFNHTNFNYCGAVIAGAYLADAFGKTNNSNKQVSLRKQESV